MQEDSLNQAESSNIERLATLIRRSIIYVLISTLLMVLMLDALLFWLDPIGLVEHSHAHSSFHLLIREHETGYRLQTGQHLIHNYTLTIDEAGNRVTPASNSQATCTIAAIGDSVTMGSGVDDDKTWVNQLAIAFPDVAWINTGRSNYSAPNVLALQMNTDADGYIWLIIDNDNIEALTVPGTTLPGYAVAATQQELYPSATRLHLNYLRSRLNTSAATDETLPIRPINDTLFYDVASQILTQENTIGFALDVDNPVSSIAGVSRITAETYENVYFIPWYTRNEISLIDKHPNPSGHVQIAEGMIPIIERFVQQVCDDT